MSIVNWDPPHARAETETSMQPVNVMPHANVDAISPLSSVSESTEQQTTLPPCYSEQSQDEFAAEQELDCDDTDEEEYLNALGPIQPLGHRPLHRLSEVREQQGVSLRNMARRLGTDIKNVRAVEDPYNDVTISTLYAWQAVLEVPLADLLAEDNGPLSAPVMVRAQLVRLMKTVAAMQEKCESKSMQRMLQMLAGQLLEIMPELKEVGPWHTVGQRRTMEDLGRIVEQTIPDDFFRRGDS